MSSRAPHCPDCAGSPRGVPLVIGLPDAETSAAAERGEFVLGGCVMDPGPAPRWACPECGQHLRWTTPAVVPPSAGHLRIATWNVEKCPAPGSGRGAEVAWWQEELAADVWLLTEVHRDWRSSAGWVEVSPPRGGAPDTQRWAAVQTQLPMTPVHDGPTGPAAAEESLCLVRVHPPGSRSVLVACSVLPWGGAASSWPGLPERYLDHQQAFVLSHHADRIEQARDGDEPVVWGGDFNQALRRLTPERTAAGYRLPGTVAGIERLRSAFARFGLVALTEYSEHRDPHTPAIDHLAVSRSLAAGAATVHRPHREDGSLLSDHAAYTADLRVGVPHPEAVSS
jgi:hypothetical protein